MLDANASHITFTVEGANADLQVLSFTGREALNQPFRFDLELVSARPDLKLEELLHKPGVLTFGPTGEGKIHGLVYRIEQGDSGKTLTRYSLSLVPQLAYLLHNHDQQIFQQLTVPKIIAQVLEDRGILADAYSFQLGAEYPQRDYCVQYDESDLHFIQRLCEEEGIHFHFQHSSSGHKLVFGDDQTVFRKLKPVSYQQDSGMAADKPVIKRFNLRLETRTTRVSRRDYDFEKPKILPEGAVKTEFAPDLEDYDYPGRFTTRERGKFLSTRALERHRSDYKLAEGKGDEPTLTSGHFLTLAEHPRAEWNDLWLLLEVFHEGKQPQVLGENVSSASPTTKAISTRATATASSPPHGTRTTALPSNTRNQKSSAARPPSSPAPQAKKFTATNTAGSKCNSTGTATARATTKPLAGCASPAAGPARLTAASPSRASAWKSSSPSSKAIPTSRW
ncbi:Rhs element Vgr protein [Pseudomonas sp. GM16]|nr:Rhs element Vgr protein [Pseudomonas sp. GM16]